MEKMDSTSSRTPKFKSSRAVHLHEHEIKQEVAGGLHGWASEQGAPDKTWAQKEGYKRQEQGYVAKTVGRVTVQSAKDVARKTKVHLELSLGRGCKEWHKIFLPLCQQQKEAKGKQTCHWTGHRLCDKGHRKGWRYSKPSSAWSLMIRFAFQEFQVVETRRKFYS